MTIATIEIETNPAAVALDRWRGHRRSVFETLAPCDPIQDALALRIARLTWRMGVGEIAESDEAGIPLVDPTDTKARAADDRHENHLDLSLCRLLTQLRKLQSPQPPAHRSVRRRWESPCTALAEPIEAPLPVSDSQVSDCVALPLAQFMDSLVGNAAAEPAVAEGAPTTELAVDPLIEPEPLADAIGIVTDFAAERPTDMVEPAPVGCAFAEEQAPKVEPAPKAPAAMIPAPSPPRVEQNRGRDRAQSQQSRPDRSTDRGAKPSKGQRKRDKKSQPAPPAKAPRSAVHITIPRLPDVGSRYWEILKGPPRDPLLDLIENGPQTRKRRLKAALRSKERNGSKLYDDRLRE